jgi:hypothetical protein
MWMLSVAWCESASARKAWREIPQMAPPTPAKRRSTKSIPASLAKAAKRAPSANNSNPESIAARRLTRPSSAPAGRSKRSMPIASAAKTQPISQKGAPMEVR